MYIPKNLFQNPPKFTQVVTFCLKIYHLATLAEMCMFILKRSVKGCAIQTGNPGHNIYGPNYPPKLRKLLEWKQWLCTNLWTKAFCGLKIRTLSFIKMYVPMYVAFTMSQVKNKFVAQIVMVVHISASIVFRLRLKNRLPSIKRRLH
jgi:hypothetical protein